MTPRRRWIFVAVTAVVLAATPSVLTLLPAKGSDLSASALRTRIARSAGAGFSGYVETRGTLQVPDSKSFAGVATLLGENNELRVWWRGPTEWRVDRIFATGESDLFRFGDRSTRWRFESERATVSPVSTIRLPDASDLLPATLARRMLQGARRGELSRLPSRRIAGRSAAGLRLDPADPASTIDRIDMWADPKTGVALEVRLYTAGDDRPVVSTRMREVDLGQPLRATTRFTPPPGIRVRFDPAVDVAAGANVFAEFVPPTELAGFAQRTDAPDAGAVGVYGRGPTAFLAVPLRHRLSHKLRDSLLKNAASEDGAAGTTLRVGPLTVLVTPADRDRVFLLAGTVTPAALQRAATELLTGQAPR